MMMTVMTMTLMIMMVILFMTALLMMIIVIPHLGD